jgi:hypothetical protein
MPWGRPGTLKVPSEFVVTPELTSGRGVVPTPADDDALKRTLAPEIGLPLGSTTEPVSVAQFGGAAIAPWKHTIAKNAFRVTDNTSD